jgi:hypothetical protein
MKTSMKFKVFSWSYRNRAAGDAVMAATPHSMHQQAIAKDAHDVWFTH